MTKEELIEKGYVFKTYQDIQKCKSDIEVLSLPRKLICEDEDTYYLTLEKLSQCHIGTVSTKETLTIIS